MKGKFIRENEYFVNHEEELVIVVHLQRHLQYWRVQNFFIPFSSRETFWCPSKSEGRSTGKCSDCSTNYTSSTTKPALVRTPARPGCHRSILVVWESRLSLFARTNTITNNIQRIVVCQSDTEPQTERRQRERQQQSIDRRGCHLPVSSQPASQSLYNRGAVRNSSTGWRTRARVSLEPNRRQTIRELKINSRRPELWVAYKSVAAGLNILSPSPCVSLCCCDWWLLWVEG